MTSPTGDATPLPVGLGYKPGWQFKRGGPNGSMLCIFATTVDSSNPDQTRCTQHQFTIPDGHPDLVRWVFDCLLLCELHEAGEFFQAEGVRPFFPHHADGDPYALVDRRKELAP